MSIARTETKNKLMMFEKETAPCAHSPNTIVDPNWDLNFVLI